MTISPDDPKSWTDQHLIHQLAIGRQSFTPHAWRGMLDELHARGLPEATVARVADRREQEGKEEREIGKQVNVSLIFIVLAIVFVVLSLKSSSGKQGVLWIGALLSGVSGLVAGFRRLRRSRQR